MSIIMSILMILGILALAAIACVVVGFGLVAYFLSGSLWRKLVGSPK